MDMSITADVRVSVDPDIQATAIDARSAVIALSHCSAISSSTSTRRVCRICFTGDCSGDDPRLVRACKCSGSMALVHHVCLSQWLAQSAHRRCNICLTPFVCKGWRFKPLDDWNSPLEEWGTCDATKLIGCIVHVILRLVLIPLVYMLYTLLCIAIERRLWDRLLDARTKITGDDVQGCILFVVFFLVLLYYVHLEVRQVRKVFHGYFDKQKERIFATYTDEAVERQEDTKP